MKIILCWMLGIMGVLNASKSNWETTDSLWSYSIANSCQVGLNKCPKTYFRHSQHFDKTLYAHIQKGDIVWLPCVFVPIFCKEVLPEIQHPFVLVINDGDAGDHSFPSELNDFDVEELLNNKNVIHVFAQNCDYNGPSNKVSHLPVGLDFHSRAYKKNTGPNAVKVSPKEQENELKKILLSLKPTYQRKKLAFVDFQHSDSMHGSLNRYLKCGEDRKSIFERLVPTGLLKYTQSRIPRTELWKKKGKYAFSISPHGNGLDCHRTWEDLILGCIVIVKTSPLDPLYEGLPVVIVQDWSEITKENLSKWLKQYGDAFTNPSYREKLLNTYWIKKIAAYTANHD